MTTVRGIVSRPRRPAGARIAVRLLVALTVSLQLAYLITVVVPLVDPAADAALSMAAEWAAVVTCWLAVLMSRSHRAAPALVAGAVTATVLGDTLYLAGTGPSGAAPFPSSADFAYLLFYLLMLAAIIVLGRRHLVTPTRTVVFDVVIGSLGMSALLALMLSPVLDAASTGSSAIEIALSVAYPLLDLVLVATLIAVVASDRSGASWSLLAGGLLLFAGADVIFALQLPVDGYAVGTALDAAWAIGVLLMAFWVCQATSRTDRAPLRASATRIGAALAIASMIGALVVLVVAPLLGGSVIAVALAMATLITTVVSVAVRRRVVPSFGATALRIRTLRELHSPAAIDRIVLVYQPKLRLSTSRIDAVEALVRWDHPSRGLLGAPEFVPLLAEAGVLGEWTSRILTLALDDAARWQRRGIPLSVAVNVTADWLQDEGAASAVLPALRERALHPSMLTLELTEQSLVVEPAKAAETLAPLLQAGVRLSLDDFGTGYNSLSALHDIAVNEVKIDRSFVDGLVTDARSRSLVRSTIALARELGSETVAEGVQTDEQLALLAEMGCTVVQGYLISPPVPAARIDDLLASPGTPRTPLR